MDSDSRGSAREAVERCRHYVETFQCCGVAKNRWTHQRHFKIAEDDNSLCPGGLHRVEITINGRCCSGECCIRAVKATEDFEELLEIYEQLPADMFGRGDDVTKWKDSKLRQALRSWWETERHKERRLEKETLAGRLELVNVGIEKVRLDHQKRCQHFPNDAIGDCRQNPSVDAALPVSAVSGQR